MIDTMEQHLQKYGIRHFTQVSDYDDWLESKLSRDQIQDILESTPRLTRDHPLENLGAYWEYIADARIAPLLQSAHADAIKKSGLLVNALLRGREAVLDVGCAAGYLATWYALSDPRRQVTGVDYSGTAIEMARAHAEWLGINNVQFHHMDITQAVPEGLFDAIVGTQCFEFVPGLEDVAGELVAHLNDDGILVSVALSPNDLHIHKAFQAAGLRISPIRYLDTSDAGETTRYGIVIGKK